MAKIPRATQYPFGSGASVNEMATFGSLAAGNGVVFSGAQATPSLIQGVTYTFIISSHSASAGAQYTNNGVTYTVLQAVSSGTTLLCSGAAAPTASGTLTYVSGTPTGSITFSGYTAQASTQFLGGWYDAVVGNTNSPTIQDMNSLFDLHSYQISYILQQGIPEYDPNTTYYQFSIVQSSGVIYQYINATGSAGNTPPNGTFWQVLLKDANSNFSANNFIDGFTTTATAAGTTTLTVASAGIQEFTGTTTQTVILPVVSTLSPGQQFTIQNTSAGVVTISSSGSDVIGSLSGGQEVTVTYNGISGTGIDSWNTSSNGGAGGGAKFFVSNAVTTDSSAVSSGSFVTFDNSPAFTFTPGIGGTYKVYCFMPLDVAGSGVQGIGRIFETTALATLVNESQAIAGGTAILVSVTAQSVYVLTPGVTYTFDIQGRLASGSVVECTGSNCTFYMFAELVS